MIQIMQNRQSNVPEVKRYLVNKIPQMSKQELMIVGSMIDKKLQLIVGEENEPVIAEWDKISDWERIKKQLYSKVRYQLLYNAIQSRLISDEAILAQTPE